MALTAPAYSNHNDDDDSSSQQWTTYNDWFTSDYHNNHSSTLSNALYIPHSRSLNQLEQLTGLYDEHSQDHYTLRSVHNRSSSSSDNILPCNKQFSVVKQEPSEHSQFILEHPAHPNSPISNSPKNNSKSSLDSATGPLYAFDEDDLLSDDASSPNLLPHSNAFSSSTSTGTAPLRAVFATPEMRAMMGVFRLNPFTVVNGVQLRPGTSAQNFDNTLDDPAGAMMPWDGGEPRALQEEPVIVEFQLDGYYEEDEDEDEGDAEGNPKTNIRKGSDQLDRDEQIGRHRRPDFDDMHFDDKRGNDAFGSPSTTAKSTSVSRSPAGSMQMAPMARRSDHTNAARSIVDQELRLPSHLLSTQSRDSVGLALSLPPSSSSASSSTSPTLSCASPPQSTNVYGISSAHASHSSAPNLYTNTMSSSSLLASPFNNGQSTRSTDCSGYTNGNGTVPGNTQVNGGLNHVSQGRATGALRVDGDVHLPGSSSNNNNNNNNNNNHHHHHHHSYGSTNGMSMTSPTSGSIVRPRRMTYDANGVAAHGDTSTMVQNRTLASSFVPTPASLSADLRSLRGPLSVQVPDPNSMSQAPQVQAIGVSSASASAGTLRSTSTGSYLPNSQQIPYSNQPLQQQQQQQQQQQRIHLHQPRQHQSYLDRPQHVPVTGVPSLSTVTMGSPASASSFVLPPSTTSLNGAHGLNGLSGSGVANGSAGLARYTFR